MKMSIPPLSPCSYYDKLLHLWDWNTSTHFTKNLPCAMFLCCTPSFPTSITPLYVSLLHPPSSSSPSAISRRFLPCLPLSAHSSLSKLKSIWYGVWPLASQLLSIEVIVTHREMKTASIMFDLASQCLQRIFPLSFRQATYLHAYFE